MEKKWFQWNKNGKVLNSSGLPPADTIQLLVSRPVTTKQWLICAFVEETAARYHACVWLREPDPQSRYRASIVNKTARLRFFRQRLYFARATNDDHISRIAALYAPSARNAARTRAIIFSNRGPFNTEALRVQQFLVPSYYLYCAWNSVRYAAQ